jgi:hypothetical protein
MILNAPIAAGTVMGIRLRHDVKIVAREHKEKGDDT